MGGKRVAAGQAQCQPALDEVAVVVDLVMHPTGHQCGGRQRVADDHPSQWHHGAAGHRLAGSETVTATTLAAEIGRYLAALGSANHLVGDGRS